MPAKLARRSILDLVQVLVLGLDGGDRPSDQLVEEMLDQLRIHEWRHEGRFGSAIMAHLKQVAEHNALFALPNPDEVLPSIEADGNLPPPPPPLVEDEESSSSSSSSPSQSATIQLGINFRLIWRTQLFG